MATQKKKKWLIKWIGAFFILAELKSLALVINAFLEPRRSILINGGPAGFSTLKEVHVKTIHHLIHSYLWSLCWVLLLFSIEDEQRESNQKDLQSPHIQPSFFFFSKASTKVIFGFFLLFKNLVKIVISKLLNKYIVYSITLNLIFTK